MPESTQVRTFAARLDDVPGEKVGRYGKLTSLDAPDEPAVPQRVVKMQVDRKWVAQRDECRLTEEDLYVPEREPVQRLGLNALSAAPLLLLDQNRPASSYQMPREGPGAGTDRTWGGGPEWEHPRPPP